MIVAAGPQPSLLAAAGLSLGVAVLLAFSLALAIAGLISLQQRRRRDARALSAAEGRRAEAERRSRTDALTGLYNRRHMLDAIAAELARSERTGVPPSVLMLDIDNVRRINEGYGHDVGDRVLSEIARRLRGRLRGYDVLGRWDDEAFVALMPGIPDDETLRSLAEQIRRLVGALPVAVDDRTLLPVTVSVGAARAGDALRSVEGLVDCAHRALAAAKRRGRDRVQLFSDLTVEDLVAEEPETIRLARALALASSARAGLPRVDAERVSELAASISEMMRLGEPVTPAAGSQACYTTLALSGCPSASSRSSGRPSRATGSPTRCIAGAGEQPGAQRRRRQRSRGDRRRARGALRRHRLSGRPERPAPSRREPIVACAAAHVKLAQILAGEPLARARGSSPASALDPVVVSATLAHLAREDARRDRRTCPRPDPPDARSHGAAVSSSRWPTRCS